MNNLKSLFYVLFVVLMTTLLLVWVHQKSLGNFWQQHYHSPPPWQSLSAYPTWALGAKITPALEVAAISFWQELQAKPPQPLKQEPLISTAIAENGYSPIPSPSTREMILNHQPTAPTRLPKTQLVLNQEDHVLFVGDSMMQGIAPLLGATLRKEYNIASTNLSKQSTGLAYPNFFNWPQTIQKALAANPNIKLVAMFLGPNDPWDMPSSLDGRYLSFRSEDWEADYRQRIQTILQSAQAHGADVMWVSPPHMRKKKLSEDMTYLSDLYESEVLAANEIHLSANDIFKYQANTYSDYLGDGSGTHKLRAGDGIHFTRTGQRAIANAMFNLISVASTTQAEQDSDLND